MEFQNLVKFKHICGKMEALKFRLEANMCHSLDKFFNTSSQVEVPLASSGNATLLMA
jgi:hypothetical protein